MNREGLVGDMEVEVHNNPKIKRGFSFLEKKGRGSAELLLWTSRGQTLICVEVWMREYLTRQDPEG